MGSSASAQKPNTPCVEYVLGNAVAVTKQFPFGQFRDCLSLDRNRGDWRPFVNGDLGRSLSAMAMMLNRETLQTTSAFTSTDL